jgi:hypothetical protein
MQKITALSCLFKFLWAAHTMIFCIFWGRSVVAQGHLTAPCAITSTAPSRPIIPRPPLVLLAAAQQPLHVRIVLKDPEQVLEPHRLAWVPEASDGFHVGQYRAVRESAPRVLLQGAHLLQGLDDRLPEPLIG